MDSRGMKYEYLEGFPLVPSTEFSVWSDPECVCCFQFLKCIPTYNCPTFHKNQKWVSLTVSKKVQNTTQYPTFPRNNFERDVLSIGSKENQFPPQFSHEHCCCVQSRTYGNRYCLSALLSHAPRLEDSNPAITETVEPKLNVQCREEVIAFSFCSSTIQSSSVAVRSIIQKKTANLFHLVAGWCTLHW